ncbi:hypothetical protein [Sphingomonas sp. IC081]|uniref:hypothetical protein n=1 Tax=Sphingomonas sp. IC081 TaxID=304378 RepID=UPI001157F9C0|nr:hypothetical protein [Sphingomonas sp. IC081]
MTRADLIARWVAAGCPDDAFFRSEASQGKLVTLGLPKWWATVRLIPRPDEGKGKGKGKRK